MMKTQPVPQSDSPVTKDAHVGVSSNTNSSMLIVTSALLLHVAIQDGSVRPWIEWTDLFVTILLAASGFSFFRIGPGARTTSVFRKRHRESIPGTSTLVVHAPRSTRLTTHSRPSTLEVGFLLFLGSLPFITDIVLRRYASHGNPLEIQVTLALRNLMFGLAVLPRRYAGRLAIFASLFLAIYGALVTVSTTTNLLLGTYALLGLWWLMGDYWQRISAHFPDESITEIPYFARVGAVGLVLFCLAGGAVAFRAHAVTSAVAGFLPSSGGTGGSDPFARGGVGDGEQMVGATEDASSFGPIESELFLESQQPTLYDMFIENYEPPSPKRRKSRSGAIPLTSQENQKQNHNRLAQNKKSSREFSAIRRESADRKRQELDDLASKVLLYVAGRTPLHLGLAIFDHWDGRELSLRSELAEPTLRLEQDDAKRKWATWKNPQPSDCFADPERHLVKIINLSSATIPAPPNVTATHIDKLHDAGFFRWENGMLRLRGDKIPSLTVVHVESRPLHRNHLGTLRLRRDSEPASPASAALLNDGSIPDRLRQLAEDWTAGARSDWQRVERICERLRTLDHDSKALVPEDTSDAVEYFLFESRRGPDYLFATSAAVLLRSLGYQTRVISGLYADPDNYDRIARATGVYADNVHFWTEVQTEEGPWVAVEPTPGFQVLYARQTFLENMTATMSGIARSILARPLACVLALVTIIATIVYRSRLYSWAVTSWWRFRLNTSPRQQVLHSVLLLQRLTARTELGRRVGQTLDQWIEALGEPLLDSAAIADFRGLVSWACYASSDRPAVATASVRQTCVDSVRLLKQRV